MKFVQIPQEDWVGVNDFWRKGCSLYIVREASKTNVDTVKIGVANNPFRRLAALQCGNHRPLSLYAVYCSSRAACLFLECAIKKGFAAQSLAGEWYAANVKEFENYIAPFLTSETDGHN